jgi:hypothetical protein
VHGSIILDLFLIFFKVKAFENRSDLVSVALVARAVPALVAQ